jgi:Transposase
MKRSKFTEVQIVKALKEHENGRKVEEITRELGIAPVIFLMIFFPIWLKSRQSVYSALLINSQSQMFH